MIKFVLRTFFTTVILIVVLLNLKLMLIMAVVAIIAGVLIGIFQLKEKPASQTYAHAYEPNVPVETAAPGAAAIHRDYDYDDLSEYEDDDLDDEDDLDELDDDYDTWPDENCQDEDEERVRRKFCIRCNQSEMVTPMDWEDFKDTYPDYMTDDFYQWAADYLENVQFEDNPSEVMGDDCP